MKIRVQVKGKAALKLAIEEAAVDECAALKLPIDERDAVVKARVKKTLETCAKWFVDGSIVTLEIDTDAGTCVAVPT